MKIYLLIIACLLFSCSNSEKKIPKNILPQTTFETVLKEIHLEEASFELNKIQDIENAKIKLSNAYFDIYKKNKISKKNFIENIDYYSKDPEKLEEMYTNILEQLTKEKSKLDQR
tara:strand:+ start:226 stop:570 length:345 start_codon:yes stop_codon:yes gene_type:complete